MWIQNFTLTPKRALSSISFCAWRFRYPSVYVDLRIAGLRINRGERLQLEWQSAVSNGGTALNLDSALCSARRTAMLANIDPRLMRQNRATRRRMMIGAGFGLITIPPMAITGGLGPGRKTTSWNATKAPKTA